MVLQVEHWVTLDNAFHFSPQYSVLDASVKDVGEPLHTEGWCAPFAVYVRVHLPAPGVPQ